MDNNYITIMEDDIELAQNICNAISNDEVRNRAVANIVASQVASRFFDSERYDVDTETGLHNVSRVLEDIDISDIYINGSYIDVRVYFSDDEISVPKLHFNCGLTPAVYMFVKLESDLSKANVTGFIRPDNISTDNSDDAFYYINANELNSFYDIESRLSQVLDVSDFSNEKLYELLDGTLNNNDKIQLYKELISSKRARQHLLKAAKAQSVFNFVSLNVENAEADYNEQSSEEQGAVSGSGDNLDDLFAAENENVIDEESLFDSLEYTTEVTPSGSEIIENVSNDTADGNVSGSISESTESEEHIDNLFTGEQEGIPVKTKKHSGGTFLTLLVLLLFVGGGYMWYSNSANKQNEDNFLSQGTVPDVINEETIQPVEPARTEDAMPDETVNTQNTVNNKEEANAVAIPAIEQHLDASVLVSNLKVDWEVPAGYVSNTSAKRYLVKLGKIIQLNLKSELLLLSRPPIANKITVELKYNQNTGKFEIVGIQESSGEKTVDDTILQTIKSALDLSISSNIESFGKLQGNPVLIIHL